MSWLGEQLLFVVRHHRCRLLLKLFLLCQDKSGGDETWYEWYEGKGLHSYRVDAEYLHKLCYQVKGAHKRQQSYFSWEVLVWKLMPLKRWRNFRGGHIIRCLVDKFKMVTGRVNMSIWSVGRVSWQHPRLIARHPLTCWWFWLHLKLNVSCITLA